MARAGFGSSNYGMALDDFEREHMRLLDSQTTVIVLGDGRGNRTEPRVDVLTRMADRAKQIVWLTRNTARCGAPAIPTCCATRRIAG